MGRIGYYAGYALWVPPAESSQTHCRPHVVEAVRPAFARIQSASRLGLADQPEEGCI